MKPTLIAFLLTAMVSCQSLGRNDDKNSGSSIVTLQSQPTAYDELSNDIDQLSKDILNSIKTNNYATFSNFLSSKDTIQNFLVDGLKKGGADAKEIAEMKDHAEKEFAKSLVTTKKDFDYIIKKGTEQGIIWSNISFEKADWKLAKNDWSNNFYFLQLDLNVYFKYKGVEHTINFNSDAFVLIGPRWVLDGRFHLDSFDTPAETDESSKTDNSASMDTSYEMDNTHKDSMK